MGARKAMEVTGPVSARSVIFKRGAADGTTGVGAAAPAQEKAPSAANSKGARTDGKG
jgi:hypothetical protein